MCHDVWLPEANGVKGSVKAVWAKKAVASVKFPLEAYTGILDAHGKEIVPQLQALMAQGVQYPMLHIDLLGVKQASKADEVVHAWHQEINYEEDDKDDDEDGNETEEDGNENVDDEDGDEDGYDDDEYDSDDSM